MLDSLCFMRPVFRSYAVVPGVIQGPPEVSGLPSGLLIFSVSFFRYLLPAYSDLRKALSTALPKTSRLCSGVISGFFSKDFFM